MRQRKLREFETIWSFTCIVLFLPFIVSNVFQSKRTLSLWRNKVDRQCSMRQQITFLSEQFFFFERRLDLTIYTKDA